MLRGERFWPVSPRVLPASLRLSVRQAQLPNGASELHALPDGFILWVKGLSPRDQSRRSAGSGLRYQPEALRRPNVSHRDSHPLEWQLASLNGVAGFAAGGSSSDRKRSRPIRALSATPHDGQRPCRRLTEDPGRTQPRAASPALQLKREWSPCPEFSSDPENPRELSKGLFATTFRRSR
jgi:hypothetical protein